MVNKVTFVGIRGGDRLNLPLDPPLPTRGFRTPGVQNKIFWGPKSDFQSESLHVLGSAFFQNSQYLRNLASVITQKNIIQPNYSANVTKLTTQIAIMRALLTLRLPR